MSFAPTSSQDAKNRPIYSGADSELGSQKKLPKRVMCFGTFDIFHPGHEYYLSQASKLADELIVVIARDHRVISGKGRDPIHPEIDRLKNVENAFPQARVILGDDHDIFAPLREYTPDILAFGYDQRVPEERIHELFPRVAIVRIGGYETDRYKSSLLRKNS